MTLQDNQVELQQLLDMVNELLSDAMWFSRRGYYSGKTVVTVDTIKWHNMRALAAKLSPPPEC